MSTKTPIYSLSISARVTLDMHSLNNEGGEGNQIQTRMVDIVAADGRLHNVNAISGDMLKHIQAEHLYRIARERTDLPLCESCRLFDANRISADDNFKSAIVGQTDAKALDLMLEKCILDDVEGNLITSDEKDKRSIPRKSVAEFGWVIGVPIDEDGRPLTATGSYFHVKYATERGEEARKTAKTEESRKGNLGQTPFNRPASSGIYAVVNHYEINRIGFNDITRRYALDEAARQTRYLALLESVLYSFIQLNGAMRSAQLPHLVALEGILSYSTDVIPAPTVSPLNPKYDIEIEQVAKTLNQLKPNSVSWKAFRSLGEFAEQMGSLIETTKPYSSKI